MEQITTVKAESKKYNNGPCNYCKWFDANEIHDSYLRNRTGGYGGCTYYKKTRLGGFLETTRFDRYTNSDCNKFGFSIHNHYGVQSFDFFDEYARAMVARIYLKKDCEEESIIRMAVKNIAHEVDTQIMKEIVQKYGDK